MSSGSIRVANLRCSYLSNPLGVDIRQPRLSWQLVSQQQNVRQSAYHLRVVDNAGEVWNTGKVLSDQSIHVPYDGPALKSRHRYTWQVRVWDQDDQASAWSEPAWWEMGLLETSEWQAQWIEPEGALDPDVFNPAPFVRKSFVLADKAIRSARIYASAHGIYELSLNGRLVSDQILAPGYTAYHKRLQYQVYDVTDQLQAGKNAMGAIIGDGWWRGSVGPEKIRNAYGEKLGFLLQLMVTFTDGSEDTIVTDGRWQTKTGPILNSDMMEGEAYDARLEETGWNTPGFDDSRWGAVHVVSYPFDNLIAESSPPIRRKEALKPVEITTTPTGQTVLDFGQNIHGRIRFSLRGKAGETLTLRHQEWLEKDGTFFVETGEKQRGAGIGLPKQAVHYIFKGEGIETYEPKFATHGFRFALVEGYSGEIQPDNFTAYAIYSDLAETGFFECSNPKITKLHNNTKWGQKGNFMDYPTDCPVRERGGWTGDAQVFARTGSTLMDTAAFFAKWLRDLAADQEKSGRVNNMIPDFYQTAGKKHPIFTGTNGSSGWGDAAVMIPWDLYQVFGDAQILADQYESMKAWFAYVHSHAQKMNWHRQINPIYWLNAKKRQHYQTLWDTKFHFGEWLEPGLTFPMLFLGIFKSVIFSRPEVASAYYKHICDLMAEIAAILGKPEEAAQYRDLSAALKKAYGEELIAKDGRMKPDQQASYVRALQFDLVPDPLQEKVVERLVDLIRANDNHLGTGFLSTGFLVEVLANNGYLDVAYDLLNQNTFPSWLYAVEMGATTIWEGWDTVQPDGTRGIGSHNHYSKGSVVAFLYRFVAGIEIGAPGYRHILIQPRPGGGLSYAKASVHSMYGEITSSWRIQEGAFKLDVIIPPNTTAEIHLPDGSKPLEVGSGKHKYSCDWSKHEKQRAKSLSTSQGTLQLTGR